MDQVRDVTVSDGRYVRMPLSLLWAIVIVAGSISGGTALAYADLRGQVEDTKKSSAQMTIVVNEDHKEIIDMHDSIVKLGDFADESRRLYNRYFRESTDPEYRKDRR